MSTNALAALLKECPDLYEVGEEIVPAACEGDYTQAAAWLQERGVVVLPADHPLRTGQPSEAMRKAFIEAAEVMMENEDVDAGLRAALAVLRGPTRRGEPTDAERELDQYLSGEAWNIVKNGCMPFEWASVVGEILVRVRRAALAVIKEDLK